MKQKLANPIRQSGFTVVELLTVLVIMMLLATIIVIDFNGQRNQRSVVLAQNETITNIRKVQSYMLSSRNISPGVPAKFYLLTFNTSQTFYTIQAVDENYAVYDVETVNFPSGTMVNVIRLPNAPKSMVDQPCIQVIFAAPFGKMYLNYDGLCNDTVVNTLRDPVDIVALTNYSALLNIANVQSGLNKQIDLNILSGRINASDQGIAL